MHLSNKNQKLLSRFFCFGLGLLLSFQFIAQAAETRLPPEQTLYDVTFGGGTFVAVGTNGVIFSSINGGPWEQRASGLTNRLQAVAYGGGTFVAAGDNGTLLSSSEGVQWSARSVAAALTSPDIAYGNGLFVLGGKGRAGFWTMLVSSNGINWTAVEIETPGREPEGLPFKGITFGVGKFLAVGGTHGENLFLTSTNGVIWKEHGTLGAVGGNNGAVKRPLTYGNGQFVMAAERLNTDDDDDEDFATLNNFQIDQLFLSEDSVSWRGIAQYDLEMTAAAAADCTFVLVKGNKSVAASRAGLEWFPVPNSSVINALTYGNGAFVGVGNAIVPLTIPPSTNPSFYVYPDSLTNVAGAFFSFQTSLPCLDPPVHFQWLHNGVPLPGATNAVLQFSHVTTNDAGVYIVLANNDAGESATSASAILTVPTEPHIPPVIVPPVVLSPGAGTGSTVFSGGDAYLSVSVADATNPPGYQWRFNGMDLPGATNSYLQLFNIQTDGVGEYTVRVSNSAGQAISPSFKISVTNASPTPPSIPAEPQSFIEGSTATLFNLYSQAQPPCVIYVFKNGTNLALPLAEGPSLKIPDFSSTDIGQYSLILSNSFGSVTTNLATISLTPPGPLDSWTLPYPHRNLSDITFGNGRFVAVGEEGEVLTSSDGRNWTPADLHARTRLYGITFGNGLFVAVAGVSIITSPDGVIWTTQLSRSDLFLSGAVTFGEGRFVAVGNDSILTSTDGIVWTDAVLPSSVYRSFTTVAFGNGTFVAASFPFGGPTLWISENGLNWSQLESGPAAELESITFANGLFVAVGNEGNIFTSPDGRTWTPQKSDVSNRLLDVIFGNGKYVAVGTRGRILSSPNAVSWKKENSGTPDRLESVTFGNGLFVAAGENGTILYSINGSEWFTEISHVSTEDLDGMTLGDARIVAVGKGGTVLTSTNAIDFTRQSTGIAEDLHGVGWGDGLFVAVGEPGVVLTSPDSARWTVQPAESSISSLKAVVRGPERWVAVGTQGEILTSANGVAWTHAVSPTSNDLNSVAFGAGLFVIVGDSLPPNGTLLTSPDGLNWSRQNHYIGKNLRSVTFANNMFLATANDGLVLVSPNGINWELRSTPNLNLRGATYASGVWMIVGNDGLTLSSSDGRGWFTHTVPTSENLHEIAWFGGRFVSIGNSGTILYSSHFAPVAHLTGTLTSKGFELTLTGETGVTYRIETTQNIVAPAWTTLGSVTLTEDAGTFSDASTSLGRRFYRAISP